MDTIEKLVAAAVANAVKDDIVANDKKDKAATSNTWHLDSRLVKSSTKLTLHPLQFRTLQMSLASLMKTIVGPEDNWMVTQAKRRREKDDLYKKHPGLDPVFMKI